MRIGEYSIGTLIAFAVIVCILLLPAFKVLRMIRQKKKEREITADGTVIDMQSREALQPLQNDVSEESSREPTEDAEDETADEASSDGSEEAADEASFDASEAAALAEKAPKKAKRPARRKKRLSEREYFAAFRLADGERLEIELPGHIYKRLSIGDTGFITYTDTEFVTFKWTHSEGVRRFGEELLAKVKAKKSSANADIPATAQAAAEAFEDVPETAEAAVDSAPQEADEAEKTAVGV